MVVPFSNTKLRVPPGFQSLLVGLSTEVLRSQPRNIHAFAAEYFEKLLKRRDETKIDVTEKQTALDDRFYNNQAFEEEFPVNDPETNNAAAKIQAAFRGKKTRKDLEKNKNQTKETFHDDGRDFEFRELSPVEEPKQKPRALSPSVDEREVNEDPLTLSERRDEERAKISTAAQFRGSDSNEPTTARSAQLENISDTRQSSPKISAVQSPRTLSPEGANLFGEQDEVVHQSSRFSDDFERHTEIPRDADFRNEQEDLNDEELEKAATKIQASFRGYKTRKEMASVEPESSARVEEREENEDVPQDGGFQQDDEFQQDEEDAATKIQAAFRGFKARRELGKPDDN